MVVALLQEVMRLSLCVLFLFYLAGGF
jgi:hypothetical protein